MESKIYRKTSWYNVVSFVEHLENTTAEVPLCAYPRVKQLITHGQS
jgi:hypothetical protein